MFDILSHEEIKIKTTLSYLTSVRMVTAIKNGDKDLGIMNPY